MIQHRASSRLLGLTNEPGSQNCFLNVVLQALWRLSSCRDFFLRQSSVETQPKLDDPFQQQILSSLTTLFTNFKFSNESTLPPDQVRLALAECFSEIKRFQVGEMDDAVESFEYILQSLHGKEEIDKPCFNRSVCLGHEIFAFDYMEEMYCTSCSTKVDDDNSVVKSIFTYPLYAQELLEETCYAKNLSDAISQLLNIVKNTSRKHCTHCSSSETHFRMKIKTLSYPEVFTFTFTYPVSDPEKSLLQLVLELITKSYNLNFQTCFNNNQEEEEEDQLRIQFILNGIICFYPGGHYVYFGCIREEWYLFDDHVLKYVGSLKEMVNKCLKAKYYPVMLFYEKSIVKPPIAVRHETSGFFSNIVESIFSPSTNLLQTTWPQRQQPGEVIRPSSSDGNDQYVNVVVVQDGAAATTTAGIRNSIQRQGAPTAAGIRNSIQRQGEIIRPAPPPPSSSSSSNSLLLPPPPYSSTTTTPPIDRSVLIQLPSSNEQQKPASQNGR